MRVKTSGVDMLADFFTLSLTVIPQMWLSNKETMAKMCYRGRIFYSSTMDFIVQNVDTALEL